MALRTLINKTITRGFGKVFFKVMLYLFYYMQKLNSFNRIFTKHKINNVVLAVLRLISKSLNLVRDAW